jgi:integrase
MGSIQIRGKKNRISLLFMYKGIRRYEKSDYFCETGKSGCKCRSCRAADSLLSEIERKIDENKFRYADYFPNSRTLQNLKEYSLTSDLNFGVYLWQWLESQEKLFSYSTYQTHKSIATMLDAHFGHIAIKDIKPSHVRAYINLLDVAPKTIRNRVGLLSEVMKSAIADDLISKNPCTGVKLPARVKQPVDPFTYDEMQKILSWMKKNRPENAAYFAVGFYTGMRTGEIMALKWGDIDFQKNTITVRRTTTRGKVKESTKNNKDREIDIPEELDSYLAHQKAMTFLKSEFVFLTTLGEPFLGHNSILNRYWKPCLKALGLRYRQPYQMRHSFACIMIEANEDLNWIKNTLGHSSLKMLIEHYGNRIERRQIKGRRKFATKFATK